MSPKAFLVLLAVTVVAVLGAIGVVAVQPKTSAYDTLGGGPMFSSLSQRVADVQKVAVQTAAYKLNLEKRGGKWVAVDHGGYPTKDGAVADVVDRLAAMTRVEPKTDNPQWYQYIQVGDPPGKPDAPTGIRVTASATNGDALIDAIVGSESSSIAVSHSRGGTFVRNVGQAQSWLVEGTIMIPGTLGDWFDPLFGVPGSNVTSVAVLIGDKTVFEAQKADVITGQYKIVHLDEGVGSSDMVANDDEIRGLVAGIVNLEPLDVRSLNSITLGAASRTNRFTMTDGMQLDVTLADADGTTWAILKASAPAGSDAAKAAAKVNAAAESWAFKFDYAPIARLTTNVTELVRLPGQPAAPDQGGSLQGRTGVPFVPPGGQLPLPPGFSQGGAPTAAPRPAP